MRRDSRIAVVRLFLSMILCILAPPASAHSPYEFVDQQFPISGGRSVELVRFYIDGIVAADPGRAELRIGPAVIAYTPEGSTVRTYCSNLDRCWVTVFQMSSLWPETWQLDNASINWQEPVTVNPFAYDPVNQTDPPSAVAFIPVMKLGLAAISCILLVHDYAAMFSILLAIWFGLSYGMRWLNHRHFHAGGQRFPYVSNALGWIFLLGLMVFGLFLLVFEWGFPLLLALAVLALAGLLRRRLERWLPQKFDWLRGHYTRLPPMPPPSCF